MQGSLARIATAALFTSVLSGHAAQGELPGSTVPHGTSSPAGKGTSATSSPIDRPPHDTILNAPSAFNCRGEGAYADVFERQCESNTDSND